METKSQINEDHHRSLKMYVNDVIGLERDIANALEIQMQDDRVKAHPELVALLHEALRNSEERIRLFKDLSDREGGNIGAAIKEGVTAVTGLLAGLYGKVREDPVSRMVRDDIIALNVSSVSYGMLLTLGLAIGHAECADLAGNGLSATPPLIVRLTDLLPEIVATELAENAPLTNPAAVQLAQAHIRDSWNHA